MSGDFDQMREDALERAECLRERTDLQDAPLTSAADANDDNRGGAARQEEISGGRS